MGPDLAVADLVPRESVDQLIVALHEGVFEEPYWTTFLASIRQFTRADYASLVFQRTDARSKEISLLNSGGGEVNESAEEVSDLVLRLKLSYQSIHENRAHSLDEIVDFEGDRHSEYLEYLRARQIDHALVMRVTEPHGGTGWLTLGRSQSGFAPWVRDLLKGLAPHLRLAARTLAALEQQRIRADIATDAVRRLNFGWLTFDARARVIDIDPEAERLFRSTPSLSGYTRGHTFTLDRGQQRDLAEVLAAFADRVSLQPRAIHLADEPWLDMLILPVRYRAVSGGPTPVAVGYVHGAAVASAERCAQLALLFGLTNSEARLALALTQGKSIAEAAGELNLTVETARNYSKKIYAKTDTRSQSDLVRIILASILALT